MSALVFCDGFDKYGPAGNVGVNWTGDWSSSPVGNSVVAPLSAFGFAMRMTAGTSITSSAFQTITRVAGSLRFNFAAGVGRVTFLNAAASASAFTIDFSAANGVQFRTGTSIGTVIGSGGTLTNGTTHVVAWDVTLGTSGAAFAVYLDGALCFSGTGNTSNSVASVGTTQLGTNSGAVDFDDFPVYDGNHAAYNNAVLTASAVVETQFPSSDTQTQFTNDANAIPVAGIAARGVYRTTTGVLVGIANALFLQKITPVASCTLNSVCIVPATTAAAAKFKAVIYTDSASAPATLLNTGTEVVGTILGVTLTLPLSTPQSLVGGTSYWIGFIVDTIVQYQSYDNTTLLAIRKANTYTSGPPSPAGGSFSSGIQTFLIWGNATGGSVNYPSISLNPPLGTAQSQIHSATVGQEDLYGFPALATTPTTIFGMAVKAFVAKSDTGARTMSLNTKSGASDTTGSNPSQTLSTTPQWQSSAFDLDSATGVAWTPSGLNAASSGVSVAS